MLTALCIIRVLNCTPTPWCDLIISDIIAHYVIVNLMKRRHFVVSSVVASDRDN